MSHGRVGKVRLRMEYDFVRNLSVMVKGQVAC